MNEMFADWYREIDPNPNTEKLELMWNATEALAMKNLSKDKCLAMVRFALFEDNGAKDLEKELTSHFKEHDPSFLARDNQHALRVLSTISLILYAREEKEAWYLVALAAICGSWQKSYARDVQVDFLKLVKQQVVDIAASQRRLALIPSSNLKVAEFSEAVKDFREVTFTSVPNNQASIAQENLETFRDGLAPVLNALDAALKQVDRLPTSQQLAQEMLAEENNVLWWVFSEYSRELNQPIAEVHKDAWTLRAASELEMLTTVLPAPESMKAVLYKSLYLRDKSKKKVALDVCVNACERNWRQNLLNTLPVASIETFTPVLKAISASLQLDEDVDWTSIFDRATDLDARTQVSRHELAWQTYQELMLARVYRDE